MDIVTLAAQCDQQAAVATALSDRLMATAMAEQPGETQRSHVIAAHCLVTLAELWRQRRPVIDVPEQPVHDEPPTDVDTYRRDLIAELASWSIDPFLDPSTDLLASRVRAELERIKEVLS
ncbi:MAG: hypothetical protein O2925_01970 [Actinomycetota bacterium]|nr:hypothetical protein [Actinomycetota bacterium]MDA3027538.1 hypothetical protein [Actinomycetota bacterium]